MMAFFDELFLRSSYSKLSDSSMEQWKISFENHVLSTGVSDPLGLHLSHLSLTLLVNKYLTIIYFRGC